MHRTNKYTQCLGRKLATDASGDPQQLASEGPTPHTYADHHRPPPTNQPTRTGQDRADTTGITDIADIMSEASAVAHAGGAHTQNSGHKVRRPRAARACNLCRLKKNKCDELYPCTYCRSESHLSSVTRSRATADHHAQIAMLSVSIRAKT